MKAVRMSGRWRPVVGVLALGVFAFSLSLEGSPADTATSPIGRGSNPAALPTSPQQQQQQAQGKQPLLSAGLGQNKVQAGVPIEHLRNRGHVVLSNLPVLEPITVNPYTDEASLMRERGELVGPWRPRANQGAVADHGACTFNIDCDTCDPCSTDRCIIAVGAPPGSGTCNHEPIPNGSGASACSNGVFCDGLETCFNGVCEEPGSGTGVVPQLPCDEIAGELCDAGQLPGNPCVLSCTLNLCKGGANAGQECGDDTDCPAGSCQTGDAYCNDGILCNGVETCNIDTGLCEAGENPCGAGAICSETTCANGSTCGSNSECIGGIGCEVRATAGCFNGRCCTPVTRICDGGSNNGNACTTHANCPGGTCVAAPGTAYNCSKRTKSNCTAAGTLWFAGPGGQMLQSDVCSVALGGCPKYSGGIIDFNAEDNFTVTVGPINDSACNNVFEVGDDYTFQNGEYVDVRSLTFAGGGAARFSFEFYDANNNFIEDTFFVSGGGLAIRTVQFDPPITIPPSGFVVARVATNFTPNASAFWLATDVVDIGTNDPNGMWANGAPISGYINECEGGNNPGAWCRTVDDCDGGTCEARPDVLAFEMIGDKSEAPIGACCDSATGSCRQDLPWTCRADGGVFNGVGTLCRLCSADSIAIDQPCGTCLGGTNNGAACDGNADCDSNNCAPNDTLCRFCDLNSSNVGTACTTSGDCTGAACVGGSNPGTPCTLPAGSECSGGGVCTAGQCVGSCDSLQACAEGACCNTATGECTEGHAGSCPGGAVWQGYGSDCDPDCCVQPVMTGGDDCEGVTLIQFTGVGPGYNETRTITGNNSTASGPDSCAANIFNQDLNTPETVDNGWWEGYTADSCHFVRFDMCCTDPVHAPQWVVMWNACPCQDGQLFANVANPNKPNLPANNRGAPFCDDDNLWWQYGPLPEGTYYQPVYSALAGHFGEYQMHITVEGCPLAACCHLECAGGANAGNGCQTNADCPSSTCESVCDLLNVLDCDDVNGFYLAPPNKSDPVTFCTGATCATGSCCTGPGSCEDQFGVGGDPVTKADCDILGGTYNGGIRCAGGTCTNDINASCRVDGDCPPGGECIGDAVDLAQPTPCPVCEIERASGCQFVGGGGARLADRCTGNCQVSGAGGTRVADDFIAATAGSVDTICVSGYYGLQGAGLAPCWNTVAQNDKFYVTIYDDNGGLPGSPVVATQQAVVVARGQLNAPLTAYTQYQFSLNNPIPLNGGVTYWLEVVAETDDTSSDANCDWFWAYSAATQGNQYSVHDFGSVFTAEDIFALDYTWCMNIGVEVPPTPMRACCQCGGVCADSTFQQCAALNGDWSFSDAECASAVCAGVAPKPNEECVTAIEIGETTQLWNNLCVSSSPAPLDVVACDNGNQPFRRDIWYHYTAGCDGQATVSLCDPDREIDSVLAIYHDASDPTNCPCPTSAALQHGDCDDDGCVFIAAGSEVNFNATEGHCYTVRIGGWNGDTGYGRLTTTCGAVLAPDRLLPDPAGPAGALACNAGDNYGVHCKRCTGGSRNGLPCLAAGDCSGGGTCDASDAACPGGTCADLQMAHLKNRFIGVRAPSSALGIETAIRLRLVDIPGNAICNGEVRWAQAPGTFNEGAVGTPTFRAAQLGGAPVWHDWAAEPLVYLYGVEVIPGARYEAQLVAQSCEATLENEDCYSAPLAVVTAKWGDVVAPAFPFTGAAQPDVSDVSALVAKFGGAPGAIIKARAKLQPQNMNPALPVDVSDISGAVSGFQGNPYPHAVTGCTP